ncbi:calcineurin-binding protein cabin-1 [Pelomyxa schiedti]|nr:calcineurin-binding protein cabin-1 [Pelomyxa schiedti]
MRRRLLQRSQDQSAARDHTTTATTSTPSDAGSSGHNDSPSASSHRHQHHGGGHHRRGVQQREERERGGGGGGGGGGGRHDRSRSHSHGHKHKEHGKADGEGGGGGGEATATATGTDPSSPLPPTLSPALGGGRCGEGEGEGEGGGSGGPPTPLSLSAGGGGGGAKGGAARGRHVPHRQQHRPRQGAADAGSPSRAQGAVGEQEVLCMSLYRTALDLHQQENFSAATVQYIKLLEQECIKNVALTGGEHGLKTKMLKLKYLGYKNLGAVLHRQGDNEGSINCFLNALQLDNTDVMVLLNLAQVAREDGNMTLGRWSLETALMLNPTYWPTLKMMTELLYVIGDYPCCMKALERALIIDPNWSEATVLRNEINIETSPKYMHSLIDMSWMNSQKEDADFPLVPSQKGTSNTIEIVIEKPLWSLLLPALLKAFENFDTTRITQSIHIVTQESTCGKSWRGAYFSRKATRKQRQSARTPEQQKNFESTFKLLLEYGFFQDTRREAAPADPDSSKEGPCFLPPVTNMDLPNLLSKLFNVDAIPLSPSVSAPLPDHVAWPEKLRLDAVSLFDLISPHLDPGDHLKLFLGMAELSLEQALRDGQGAEKVHLVRCSTIVFCLQSSPVCEELFTSNRVYSFRFLWMRHRICECNGELHEAEFLLYECKKQLATLDPPRIVLPHCSSCPCIDREVLEAQYAHLSQCMTILAAQLNGNMPVVIQELEKIIPIVDEPQKTRFQLALAQAYSQDGNFTSSLQVILKLLHGVGQSTPSHYRQSLFECLSCVLEQTSDVDTDTLLSLKRGLGALLQHTDFSLTFPITWIVACQIMQKQTSSPTQKKCFTPFVLYGFISAVAKLLGQSNANESFIIFSIKVLLSPIVEASTNIAVLASNDIFFTKLLRVKRAEWEECMQTLLVRLHCCPTTVFSVESVEPAGPCPFGLWWCQRFAHASSFVFIHQLWRTKKFQDKPTVNKFFIDVFVAFREIPRFQRKSQRTVEAFLGSSEITVLSSSTSLLKYDSTLSSRVSSVKFDPVAGPLSDPVFAYVRNFLYKTLASMESDLVNDIDRIQLLKMHLYFHPTDGEGWFLLGFFHQKLLITVAKQHSYSMKCEISFIDFLSNCVEVCSKCFLRATEAGFHKELAYAEAAVVHYLYGRHLSDPAKRKQCWQTSSSLLKTVIDSQNSPWFYVLLYGRLLERESQDPKEALQWYYNYWRSERESPEKTKHILYRLHSLRLKVLLNSQSGHKLDFLEEFRFKELREHEDKSKWRESILEDIANAMKSLIPFYKAFFKFAYIALIRNNPKESYQYFSQILTVDTEAPPISNFAFACPVENEPVLQPFIAPITVNKWESPAAAYYLPVFRCGGNKYYLRKYGLQFTRLLCRQREFMKLGTMINTVAKLKDPFFDALENTLSKGISGEAERISSQIQDTHHSPAKLTESNREMLLQLCYKKTVQANEPPPNEHTDLLVKAFWIYKWDCSLSLADAFQECETKWPKLARKYAHALSSSITKSQLNSTSAASAPIIENQPQSSSTTSTSPSNLGSGVISPFSGSINTNATNSAPQLSTTATSHNDTAPPAASPNTTTVMPSSFPPGGLAPLDSNPSSSSNSMTVASPSTPKRISSVRHLLGAPFAKSSD